MRGCFFAFTVLLLTLHHAEAFQSFSGLAVVRPVLHLQQFGPHSLSRFLLQHHPLRHDNSHSAHPGHHQNKSCEEADCHVDDTRRKLVISAASFVTIWYFRRSVLLGATVAIVLASLLSRSNKFNQSIRHRYQEMRDLMKIISAHIPRRKADHQQSRVAVVTRRAMLLGMGSNFALALLNLAGGLIFNSATLGAEGGHSLSDVVTDIVGLLAVQVSQLPPDKDHPYGHGKFESVGSLFLSLSLIAAGISLGVWSFGKLSLVLGTPVLAHTCASHVHIPSSGSTASKVIPLLLTMVSIAMKDFTFRVMKRAGEETNSQLLIANAWHHRTDVYSSMLALASIAVSTFIPGLKFVDSCAGMFVGGLIVLNGLDVLVGAMQQLTDSADESTMKELTAVARNVPGVLEVLKVRARRLGTASVADLAVSIDKSLTGSEAQLLLNKIREEVKQTVPTVEELLIQTEFVNTSEITVSSS